MAAAQRRRGGIGTAAVVGQEATRPLRRHSLSGTEEEGEAAGVGGRTSTFRRTAARGTSPSLPAAAAAAAQTRRRRRLLLLLLVVVVVIGDAGTTTTRTGITTRPPDAEVLTTRRGGRIGAACTATARRTVGTVVSLAEAGVCSIGSAAAAVGLGVGTRVAVRRRRSREGKEEEEVGEGLRTGADTSETPSPKRESRARGGGGETTDFVPVRTDSRCKKLLSIPLARFLPCLASQSFSPCPRVRKGGEKPYPPAPLLRQRPRSSQE